MYVLSVHFKMPIQSVKAPPNSHIQVSALIITEKLLHNEL